MSQALPHAHGSVVGRVLVPASKSETNRALVLAALADGPSVLTGVLQSRDSDLMIDALAKLGSSFERLAADTFRVTPPATPQAAAGPIDCGLAGTVMRFIPPIAALASGTTEFRGDPHASQRPMAGLLAGLRQLGATVDADRLPFALTGPLTGADEVVVDSSETSQYVSGLLLIASFMPNGLTIRHEGTRLPSRPHISMTVEMLRRRGVTVEEPDASTWVVQPGVISGLDQHIEPDLTNASVFLSAAVVTSGSVTVPGWPAESLQPGARYLDIVERMGATVERSSGSVTVKGPKDLHPIDVDLSMASELTPVVAALAASAAGRSTISGVAHIRGHETDRLKALVHELNALGIPAQETDDGLVIAGGGGRAEQPFETYADHRMVHAAAILALRIPDLAVTDLECVGKTMPDFESRWRGLVAI